LAEAATACNGYSWQAPRHPSCGYKALNATDKQIKKQPAKSNDSTMHRILDIHDVSLTSGKGSGRLAMQSHQCRNTNANPLAAKREFQAFQAFQATAITITLTCTRTRE